MTPNIIPSIFTAVDQLTGPVRRMGVSLQGLGIKAGIANQKMAASFAATGAAAMGMATSGLMVGAAIVVPLALATKAAIGFEKSMGDVETLVDTSKESMDEMSDSVLRMSKIIPKSIEDLSKGLYQIRSDGIAAGHGINQAFGVLQSSGKLAVAGLSTVEEAAESVTSAMNVFKDEGLTSEQIANSFFKTVQSGKTKMNEINTAFGRNAGIVRAAGVTLEEFNAMTATLTMTGMKAMTAQTGIAQAVTALIKPSSELQQVYESLGYSGADAFKQIVVASGGLVPAMKKIDEQGAKMGIAFSEDFREKRAMLTDIELTGTLYEAYKKYYAIQKNGKDELNTAFGKQSEKAAYKMQLFKNTIERIGISLGNLLIPALEKVTDVLTPVIDGIANLARDHKTLSGILLKGIAIFGISAVAIGGIGLAVNVVTKGWMLWNGVLKAYNFVAGFAAMKTGTLTYAMLENNAALKGAELAMDGYNASLRAAFTTTKALLAATVALYVLFKAHEWHDEHVKRVDWMLSQLPGLKPEQVEQFKRAKLDKTMGGTNEYIPLYDSLDVKYDKYKEHEDSVTKFFDKQMNSERDSLYNSSQRGTYIPDSTQSHEVSITIENNSGNPVSATSKSSLAARPVPIKIIQTF